MSQFGWLPPTPEMQADNDRYELRRLAIEVPLTVEKQLVYPPYVKEYDQGNIGACVGYSCSWATSIYNNPDCYNAYWLYKRAQKIDGDPGTSGDNDGAYLWAAGDVLRKEGHAITKTTTPKLEYGILSYYWCKSIDDVRTATDLDRVPVFGVPWYAEFNSPRTVNGEYWIGTRASWGSVLGGHAICCIAASDQRQAVRLLNTWGAGYPPVWVGYNSVTQLLKQGECMVGLDIKPEPPPPPDDDNKIFISLVMNEKEYSGELERVK